MGNLDSEGLLFVCANEKAHAFLFLFLRRETSVLTTSFSIGMKKSIKEMIGGVTDVTREDANIS